MMAMKKLIQWWILSLSLMVSCVIGATDELAALSVQSQAAIEQGNYIQAKSLIGLLEKQANTTHNLYWQTWAHAMGGYLALQQRQFERATQYLDSALATATVHNWPELIARTRLYRGQLRQQAGQWLQADQDYAGAADMAANGLPELQASAVLHRAALAQQQLAYQESGRYLQTAQQLVRSLPENTIRIHLELDLAYQCLQLRLFSPTLMPLENVYEALSSALEHAKKRHLSRQIAQALGYLSDLYTQEGRNEEAADLLQQAIFYGQQDQARDLLLHFEWQLGRYYAQHSQQDMAIAAYRRAVGHIQALRQDIPVTYENGRSSFRDTLAPAYLELAALLFDKAKNTPQQQSALLQEAQMTVEQIKKSELEDYFQNRCELPSRPIDNAMLPGGMAALYPVIFPTHLDLLLLTKAGLQHFSTPVQQTELLSTINDFAARMRAYDDSYQVQATALYRYLIQPIAAILKSQHINTLVYIPDGPLRLISLGALYDGQRYVLEDYAVIISPGLSISHTVGTSTQDGKVLLAGLSEPGGVVKELPDSLVQGLRPTNETTSGALVKNFGQRGIKLRTLLTGRSGLQKIQSSLALPSVQTEMDAIATQSSQSTSLMNQSFTLQAFSDQVQGNPYHIVHIASHGFFDGTEQNSFIMTYDHLLTMNHLDTLFNRNQTPDLLVLSACQTAEGNDRSPLGISGVMVKARVKNVLGSLWPVSDEATTLLMEHFYRYLKQGVPKAEALRQAQLVVMQRKEFTAASFWSPFILVGEVGR
jgi:CHAT domain-containing protein